ncbi:hypothetical protein ACF3VQ_21800 (plasmid) [Yersinia sp. HM-2024]|uniref:hypothetical protein n=1 Tax=Yersinia sp. HM-2024 TaxID=3344550 RepID=UPI00370D9EA2
MLACGTGAMGVRRYCCASAHCSHSKYFCQSCKSRGLKWSTKIGHGFRAFPKQSF